MEVKVTTFNTELIRAYMEQSSILQKGIAYYKHIDSSLTDAMAKECAIRDAQQYCQRRWKNDSSGWLDSEYKVFLEFEERVENGSYFKITRYDGASSDSGLVGKIGPFLKKAVLIYVIACAILAVLAIIVNVLR